MLNKNGMALLLIAYRGITASDEYLLFLRELIDDIILYRSVAAFSIRFDVVESIKAKIGFIDVIIDRVVVIVEKSGEVPDDEFEFGVSDFGGPSGVAVQRFFEDFEEFRMMLSFEPDVFILWDFIVEVYFVEEHSDPVLNASSEAFFEILIVDVVGGFIFVSIEHDIVSDIGAVVVVGCAMVVNCGAVVVVDIIVSDECGRCMRLFVVP